MKLSKIVSVFEKWAPPAYQESYDNSGLIVGSLDQEITGAIICLDSIEEVIDEAIAKKVNLVIAHHPIVFKGLKRFNGSNYVQRVIIKAIKNDIAIYACHTNLDNVNTGVNRKIADKLSLTNQRILNPKKGLLKKLVFYVAKENEEAVKEKIYAVGAGGIGDYKNCSFSVEGEGTFTPSGGAKPHIGKLNEESRVDEKKVEVLVNTYQIDSVIRELKIAHPYEEVAYEVYGIENENSEVGSGVIGELESPVDLQSFLKEVKEEFNLSVVKYTPFSGIVKTVAVCGGSGSFLLSAAKKNRADVFITSDFKYHEFFDAENRLSIFDIGHYESECFTLDLIMDYLKDKFPKFAAHLTEVNTNPVKYF